MKVLRDQQFPLKKNHEPQNGAKDGSPGEGGPEGATRPWVNADLAGTAAEGSIRGEFYRMPQHMLRVGIHRHTDNRLFTVFDLGG